MKTSILSQNTTYTTQSHAFSRTFDLYLWNPLNFIGPWLLMSSNQGESWIYGRLDSIQRIWHWVKFSRYLLKTSTGPSNGYRTNHALLKTWAFFQTEYRPCLSALEQMVYCRRRYDTWNLILCLFYMEIPRRKGTLKSVKRVVQTHRTRRSCLR